MKSVMKELCARALRDQRREQRRLLDPQRAEARSLEDVTPVLHIGLPQHPPDKEMAADAGGGDSSLQRCVGLFQEGSHWKQLEEGVWWRPSEVWNASPDNREPVGALRQGVNQDMLTRNTSGRNADDGFREWGVGKNWWGEKQTAFSLCFLPESMKIILGCHVVIRSNLDMLWEGQTDSTYEVPFDTHHMTWHRMTHAAGALVLCWSQALCMHQTFRKNAVALLANPSCWSLQLLNTLVL